MKEAQFQVHRNFVDLLAFVVANPDNINMTNCCDTCEVSLNK